MSADNMLVVIDMRTEAEVYDVGVSDVTSHPLWNMPRTPSERVELADYIRKRYKCLFRAKTVWTAKNWCFRYMRNNIVEYGWGVINGY